jgi:hypothetical protein
MEETVAALKVDDNLSIKWSSQTANADFVVKKGKQALCSTKQAGVVGLVPDWHGDIPHHVLPMARSSLSCPFLSTAPQDQQLYCNTALPCSRYTIGLTVALR